MGYIALLFVSICLAMIWGTTAGWYGQTHTWQDAPELKKHYAGTDLLSDSNISVWRFIVLAEFIQLILISMNH